jgi:hypothetical protein
MYLGVLQWKLAIFHIPDLEAVGEEGAFFSIDLAELRFHVFRCKESQMLVHNFAPETKYHKLNLAKKIFTITLSTMSISQQE